MEVDQIICGDCLEVMRDMLDDSVDTIITDPPYGLSFMGKKWDYDVPAVEIWQECLRVMKPGGTLLCFAGSRTQHRMAVNVEDAGFILKDCIMWLYGSGFPKATDISKQLDKNANRSELPVIGKWLQNKREDLGLNKKEVAEQLGLTSTAINNWERFPIKYGFPKGTNWEKIRVLYKFDGSWDDFKKEAIREVVGKTTGTKQNTGKYGEFKNNVLDITAPATPEAILWDGWKSHGLKPAYEPILVAMKSNDGTYANNALVHGVSGLNIDGARIPTEDTYSYPNGAGGCKSSKFHYQGRAEMPAQSHPQGRFPANVILDEEAGHMLDEQSGVSKSTDKTRKNKNDTGNGLTHGKMKPVDSQGYSDSGGASRFFYCAKASKKERNAGCEGLEEKQKVFNGQSQGSSKEMKDLEERWTTKPAHNHHPTVKPLALMEYLCTLTKTPTGGIVLDPFMGSGTTCKACKNTGRHYIGIDISPEYCEIARKRIEAAEQGITVKELDKGQKVLFE